MLENPASFQNVEIQWAPEVDYYYPDAIKILVVTKSDLRDDAASILENKNKKLVTFEEGEKVAKRIGCYGFIETSSLKYQNVRELFEGLFIMSNLL